MSSKKFAAFIISSVIGAAAFGLMVFRLPASDLASVGQLFFLYQGVVVGGFFGFRFGEQWANAKHGSGNDN